MGFKDVAGITVGCFAVGAVTGAVVAFTFTGTYVPVKGQGIVQVDPAVTPTNGATVVTVPESTTPNPFTKVMWLIQGDGVGASLIRVTGTVPSSFGDVTVGECITGGCIPGKQVPLVGLTVLGGVYE